MALLSKTASRRARRRWLSVRPAVDAAAALAFFTLVGMMAGSVPTSANPHMAGHAGHASTTVSMAIANAADVPTIVEIATTASPNAADAVYRRTSTTAAWVLLSFAFSLVIAFNLAVLRHMRRAYARPRVKGRS